MNSYRLRLCVAITCLGLLLSIASTSAARRAQADNASQNAASKSTRKKTTRRQARRKQRRATASKERLPKPDAQATLPTPATMNAQPLPMAPSVDVDPALYPPQQRRKEDERKTGSGLGTGIGIGSGEGAGPGRGVNVGGGESGAGNGPGINVGSGGVDYNRTFTPREVDRKARMLTRPEPQYTQLARENQISGTVVLRAIFTASGAVTNIRAISGLPYGLTERAIAAARQIKFEPAMKDGRAVSQYIQIEYNFYPY